MIWHIFDFVIFHFFFQPDEKFEVKNDIFDDDEDDELCQKDVAAMSLNQSYDEETIKTNNEKVQF